MSSKDIEAIEHAIEQARAQLAYTLDELSTRAHPRQLANDAKTAAVAKLNEPKVKYTLLGLAGFFAALLIFKILR